jgi:dolichyl-phosphate-mannose--protein O-mannosyl transferase
VRLALPAPGPRRDLAFAALAALVAAAFRLPRLGLPAEEIFDEVYHAKTALEYLNGQPPTEWVHPPTAKLLIAVPVWLFGYSSWAWRLAPALAGIALAPVFFLFARRVLATERAALLATALLLCDGVYLVQSRVAMTNIFAVLFQLAAALVVVRASLAPRLPIGGMLAAGLCLGLALSTRWTSLWAWGFLGLVFVALRVARHAREELPFAALHREAGLLLLAFFALPLGVYVLSYVPWMRQGHGLSELWPHTKAVWGYHAGLVAEHPYFSQWYTWPWLYRPTWYYWKQSGEQVAGIIALGNPALWWASLPVTAFTLWAGIRARDPRRLFAALGFCCLYLPWGLSPRTLNYGHYLFEAMPYACLSLAMLLDAHWDGPRRHWARAYLWIVVALFVYFLPLLIGISFPAAWFFRDLGGFRPWTWFRTWV